MLLASPLKRVRSLSAATVLAAGVLFFAGCASAPVAPLASLNEAKIAIETAQKSDAR